jgi:hypothetical protein
VEHSSVDAWSQALQRLYHDRKLLARLRAGIQPPQTMDAVTTKMLSIYREVLQGQVIAQTN